jgi:hypothetical protein
MWNWLLWQNSDIYVGGAGSIPGSPGSVEVKLCSVPLQSRAHYPANFVKIWRICSHPFGCLLLRGNNSAKIVGIDSLTIEIRY